MKSKTTPKECFLNQIQEKFNDFLITQKSWYLFVWYQFKAPEPICLIKGMSFMPKIMESIEKNYTDELKLQSNPNHFILAYTFSSYDSHHGYQTKWVRGPNGFEEVPK